MKISLTSMALAASLMTAVPALASNDMMLLNPDDLSNAAVLDISGNDNRLVILQDFLAGGAGNSIEVAITGDRNGGPQGRLFTGVAAVPGLEPGSLVQNGFGNLIKATVRGDDNLFAVAQVGNNNSVEASIIGFNNQASVSQMGNGNFTSLAQNGNGNIISVRQISW